MVPGYQQGTVDFRSATSAKINSKLQSQ